MRCRRQMVLATLAGAALSLALGATRPWRSGVALAGTTILYERNARSCAEALGAAYPEVRRDTDLLVILDSPTFAPPVQPYWQRQYRFRDDLTTWLSAVESLAASTSRRVGVAVSTMDSPLWTSESGWVTAITDHLRRAGEAWAAPNPQKIPPLDESLRRLLRASTDDGSGAQTVVLITGSVPAEEWTVNDRAVANMCDVGEYWREERIARLVADSHSRLCVVAPEARFGEEIAVSDIPQAPWASRPRLPPAAAVRFSVTEPEAAKLKEELRAAGASEEGLDELVERLLRHRRAARERAARKLDDLGFAPRYWSSTPWYFTRARSGVVPRNTDIPSGFGIWKLARAVAEGGGVYVFYPYPAVTFLDECRRGAQLANKQPDLRSREEVARGVRADPGTALLVAVHARLLGVTPWTFEDPIGGARADSWCGYGPRPRTFSETWAPHRLPMDVPRVLGDVSDESHVRRVARSLIASARAHRAAADEMARALASRRRLLGASPRSLANVRLSRFWCEMSAFHLDAFAIYITELDRFRGCDAVNPKELVVTHVDAVRLSDVLPAYDGRRLTAEDEERIGYATWRRSEVPGRQDAILATSPWSPEFRAERSRESTFAHLDPRLKEPAVRVATAAADVMAHDADSPWGWSVYYSVLHTFVWQSVPAETAPTLFLGYSSDPDEAPTTRPHGSGSPGASTE